VPAGASASPSRPPSIGSRLAGGIRQQIPVTRGVALAIGSRRRFFGGVARIERRPQQPQPLVRIEARRWMMSGR
jgi:hypothetical protein